MLQFSIVDIGTKTRPFFSDVAKAGQVSYWLVYIHLYDKFS